MAKFTAGKTKKQRACPHPTQHVHQTLDARFDLCDLCGVIIPSHYVAPWIQAYDDAEAAATPLFAWGYQED